MDERLEYQMDVRNEGDKWQIGGPSALSFESNEEDYVYSPHDQHVQYLPQREVRTSHRTIPATWAEVLCYVRCYLTATSKCPSMALHFLNFNWILWCYLFNVLFKSVPHTYVYVFLASYAPDDHFFLFKMVPAVYGLILCFIMAGIFDLLYYSEVLVALLDYTIMGIKLKNPWNRCLMEKAELEENHTVYCYTLEAFKKKFADENQEYLPVVTDSGYLSGDIEEEYFHFSHAFYFLERYIELYQPLVPDTAISISFILFAIIWIPLTLFHNNCLYNRRIWKVLHVTQWMVNAIYIIVFSHLCLDYLMQQLDSTEPEYEIDDHESYYQKLYEYMDLDIVSESTTAPPIIHLLSSRLTRQVKPDGDSAVIIATTGIYYIFKLLLSYRIKEYCEAKLGVAISFFGYDSHCFYILWPLYFESWFLGELFTIGFLTLHLVMEYCCALITYQCLLEAIVCEWKIARRLVASFAIAILGLGMQYLLSLELVTFTYNLPFRLATTMLEVIGVYFLYPVGRLIDDITFFSGMVPSTLRRISLKITPFYYMTKCYLLIQQVIVYKADIPVFSDMLRTCLYLFIFIAASSIILGIFYASYLKYKKHQSWSSFFKPNTNWGPDFLVRQLRKQYDSRKYISSQSPRLLSRYLFRRAEAKVYTLDIRYDYYKRSLVPNVETHMENEKKKNI